MVRKIIQLIHREIAGVHQAAYVLGIFAVSSQLLGLFRDRLLAHLFGASQTLDIYYAAFRIPDVLFLTIASIVSISVLIPFFINRLERGHQEAKQFLNSIFSVFFVAIATICIIAYLLMPFLTSVLFPGFSAESVAEVTRLSRLLLLSPIFLGFSNLFATVTQTYQRFLLHAISPLVYNLGIIAGAVFLAPMFGITGVVYGVLGGAFLHFAIQVPFSFSRGFFPRLQLRWPSPEIWRIVFHSAPRRIALSIHHIAVVFLLSLASFMAEGSIAIFQFSFNLQSVSLSVIGASYSVAAFPALTRLFSRGQKEEFKRRIITTARHIIFWSIPVAVLFIVLRAQIVRTILGSGRFDWDDTRLTAAALAIFIVSLVFQGLMLLLVRGYFATGNTRTPFLINIASGAVMIASSFGLWYVFKTSDTFRVLIETALRIEGIAGAAVLMLPLGYTIGFAVNGFLLWILFKRDFQLNLRSLASTVWQSSAAAVTAGIISYELLDVLDEVFNIQTLPGIFLQGLCAGLIGIGAGMVVLVVLRNREITELVTALRRKINGTQVITPESDTLD